MDIEEAVTKAIDELALSMQVIGPCVTDTHVCYVVRGISETPEQTENLCWCLLGFVGRIFEMDLTIDSAIGVGTQAEANLMDALKKRLDVGKELTKEQKESKRDPLLQELIAHALLLIDHSQLQLQACFGDLQALRPPHLSVNDSGLDLIAVGVQDQLLVPLVGEAKAKESTPLEGFRKACEKFSQVRRGEYNDELRQALKAMDCGFTKDQLANSVWLSSGRFAAIVGHDAEHAFDTGRPSEAKEVVEQPSDRLFLITSPFESMRQYFDLLSCMLVRLAGQVGEATGVG